jgi:hypothetical protein
MKCKDYHKQGGGKALEAGGHGLFGDNILTFVWTYEGKPVRIPDNLVQIQTRYLHNTS